MSTLKDSFQVLASRPGCHLFYIDKTASGKRLRLKMRSGNQNVSPRLPAKQLAQWIDAFVEGMNYLAYRQYKNKSNKTG